MCLGVSWCVLIIFVVFVVFFFWETKDGVGQKGDALITYLSNRRLPSTSAILLVCGGVSATAAEGRNR